MSETPEALSADGTRDDYMNSAIAIQPRGDIHGGSLRLRYSQHDRDEEKAVTIEATTTQAIAPYVRGAAR
jgi:hypothetical protein